MAAGLIELAESGGMIQFISQSCGRSNAIVLFPNGISM